MSPLASRLRTTGQEGRHATTPIRILIIVCILQVPLTALAQQPDVLTFRGRPLAVEVYELREPLIEPEQQPEPEGQPPHIRWGAVFGFLTGCTVGIQVNELRGEPGKETLSSCLLFGGIGAVVGAVRFAPAGSTSVATSSGP